MRVKLSYTVDGEDVLAETAKLINLSAADLQQAIRLFTDVQIELAGGDEDSSGPVNISKSLEMIEEFRKALLTVDIRPSRGGGYCPGLSGVPTEPGIIRSDGNPFQWRSGGV